MKDNYLNLKAVSLWVNGWSYGKIAQYLGVSAGSIFQLLKVPEDKRQALKERAGYKCEGCDKDLPRGDCHHVIRDPNHKLENLQYLCRACHAQRETMHIHKSEKATPEELDLLRNKPWRTEKENAAALKKHLDYLRNLPVYSLL